MREREQLRAMQRERERRRTMARNEAAHTNEPNHAETALATPNAANQEVDLNANADHGPITNIPTENEHLAVETRQAQKHQNQNHDEQDQDGDKNHTDPGEGYLQGSESTGKPSQSRNSHSAAGSDSMRLTSSHSRKRTRPRPRPRKVAQRRSRDHTASPYASDRPSSVVSSSTYVPEHFSLEQLRALRVPTRMLDGGPRQRIIVELLHSRRREESERLA